MGLIFQNSQNTLGVKADGYISINLFPFLKNGQYDTAVQSMDFRVREIRILNVT